MMVNSRALTAGVALLALLLCPCAAQPRPAPVTALSKFQCWSSVDFAGYIVIRHTAANANLCAQMCLSTPTCTAFTFLRSFTCLVKTLPLDASFGTTGANNSVSTSCLLKTAGGSLPSPANILCYTGQSVAGFQLPNPVQASTSYACAAQCVATSGCSFSVFWARGVNGLSNPLCQLKTNPFIGGSASETMRSPLVTSVCFRAVPSPQIVDPLAAVAGPVPFTLKSSTTGRCLRPVGSPYSEGQGVMFMRECSNGAEPLWTYNAVTQILTHYASGMCLVPADTTDGASMVLSTSCVSSPINQVYSTVSGWIQVNVGSRYLQPAAPVSNEGVIMVAKVSAPTEQYYYTPSPLQGFQCYARVRITGDILAAFPNVPNAAACAALCQSSVLTNGCSSFNFEAANANVAGTCFLQTNAFLGGGGAGVLQAANVAAACLNRASSGKLPSPANYLCYPSQRVSGNVLQTLYLGNGQACVDQCNSRPACTYALYADGVCTLGRDVFFGSGVNTPDPSVTQLCLRAMGAPDTIYRKGYTCFPQTDIAGDLVGTALATPTVEACAWKCEAMSELCSFYVYTNTQLCVLMANAFAGEFGTTGPAASKTACLRALSGGPLNSPGDFLCYPSQSISGTRIAMGANVADTAACAAVCAATATCTASLYNASAVGTCILKRDPFRGNDGSPNAFDATVSGMCLAAPGAPVVTSGFGAPRRSPSTVQGSPAGSSAAAAVQGSPDQATEASGSDSSDTGPDDTQDA